MRKGRGEKTGDTGEKTTKPDTGHGAPFLLLLPLLSFLFFSPSPSGDRCIGDKNARTSCFFSVAPRAFCPDPLANRRVKKEITAAPFSRAPDVSRQ